MTNSVKNINFAKNKESEDIMHKSLEKVMEELSRLSEEQQEQIAENIIVQLDELKWEKTFASPESQAFLGKIESKILADIEAARYEPGGFDGL